MEGEPDKHLSFSMWVSNKPESRQGFDGVQKRSRHQWVDDSSVTKCLKCGVEFGLIWPRRHHCVAADTLVTLSDGTALPISSIWNVQAPKIPAWDEGCRDVVTCAEAVGIIDQGFKDCIQVTLIDGRQIVATPDHRLLTTEGWKEMRNLSVYDSLMTHAMEGVPSEIAKTYLKYRERLWKQRKRLIHHLFDEVLNVFSDLTDPRTHPNTLQSIPASKLLEPFIMSVKQYGHKNQFDECVIDSITLPLVRHLLKGTRRTYEQLHGKGLASVRCLTFSEFLEKTNFDWDGPYRDGKRAFPLPVLSIVALKEKIHVYDLCVPHYESYITNGIVSHNCRWCGCIFCDDCCARRARIPEEVSVPEPTKRDYDYECGDPVRVCDKCFIKLFQLERCRNQPHHWAQFTSFIEFIDDVRELKAVAQVCKEWSKIANYQLSRFFEIQYRIPGQRFKRAERQMLWANRRHFPGHSRWMMQLIRSVRYATTEGLSQLDEVLRLIELHRQEQHLPRERHWNLMCTRSCHSQGFTLEELIVMMNEDVPNERVRSVLVDCLQELDPTVEELLCFVGYIVHHMSTADCAINESVFGEWLVVQQATRDIRLASEIYWEMAIRIESTNERRSNIYKYWLQRWAEAVPTDFRNPILETRAFAAGCMEANGTRSNLHRTLEDEKNRQTEETKNVRSFLGRIETTISPTHPGRGRAVIDVANVRVKESITRPIVIPLVWPNRTTEEQSQLLLKPEDVRKDFIAMNFIRLAQRILRNELDIDLHIVTYPIRPVSTDAGFIEMVPDSTTLYHIGSDKANLFNFVEGDTRVLRQRFMRSCAAYCVLTFLLGTGDRHLENIMLTRSGVLFHIDYGYIMGADPKRFGGLAKVPDMRIDGDIVSTFGGEEKYEEFKDLCDVIYNCLRRHVEPLTAILRLIVQADPPIDIRPGFSRRKLMSEILKRFAPGEDHEQARIQIINRIDNSTRSRTHYALVDALHHQAQTNRVVKAVASGWRTIKRSFF